MNAPAFRSAPDWIEALRRACERTSQGRVAAELRQEDGYPSPAIVNQVLGGRYAHPTDRLEALVRGAYLGGTVACPVLGELRLNDCIAHQYRPFATTNPLRIALYRACRGGCPHSRIEDLS